MAGDIYSQIISDGLGTGSTIIETIGLDKQAHAEEEAAQAMALLIREQTLVDAARERRQNTRQLGQQRAQIARSGISLEGSQLDLMLSNAFELELNAVYIERFGAQAAAQEDARAKSIARGAQTGRVAGLLNSMRSGGAASYGSYAATKPSGNSVPRYSPSNPAPYGQGAGVYTPEYGGGPNALGPGGG